LAASASSTASESILRSVIVLSAIAQPPVAWTPPGVESRNPQT
jgi:hypothetical protein